MYRGVLALATLGAASAFAPAALPTRAPRAAAAAKATQGLSMQRFTYPDGNEWDTQGADWAINGGIFGAVGDVIWAREAEVKHGRICMLAATGALLQVLWFVGLLEIPFLLKLANGTVDGTGDIGFDPLGLKEDPEAYARRQLTEVKNGRLAMIAISGMTHHYFLTSKGPVQFITQIPNFKSCAAAAIDTGLCK